MYTHVWVRSWLDNPPMPLCCFCKDWHTSCRPCRETCRAKSTKMAPCRRLGSCRWCIWAIRGIFIYLMLGIYHIYVLLGASDTTCRRTTQWSWPGCPASPTSDWLWNAEKATNVEGPQKPSSACSTCTDCPRCRQPPRYPLWFKSYWYTNSSYTNKWVWSI